MTTSKPDNGILNWQRSISVFVPVLNEEKNLEPTVTRLIEALTVTVEDYEIIIVDDGSSDGTAAVADGLAAENFAIRALHNSQKLVRISSFISRATTPGRTVRLSNCSATSDGPTSLHHTRSILTFGRSVAASFRASTQTCSTCSSAATSNTSTASPSIRSNSCAEIRRPHSGSAFRPKFC